MMPRRQLPALIAGLGLGLAAQALAQTPPVVAAGQSAAALRAQALGRRLTIATVVKVGGIAWFDRMHAAVRQFGVDTGHEMIIASPARAEPAAQIAVIEQMIARRVDAICVVPVAVERLEDVLQRARAAGIAVIAHEASTLDRADIILEAFDNRAFGALMMQELGLRLNGQGQYICMVGSLQTGTHMEWVNAAATYQRQRFPGMREAGPKIEIFEDADVAHRRLAEALAANPDIRGVIGAPTSAVVGTARLIAERNLRGQLHFAGTGLVSLVGPQLRNGDLTSIQFWDPAATGYAMALLAAMKLAGQGDRIQAGLDLGLEGYRGLVAPDRSRPLLLAGRSWSVATRENMDRFDF